MFFNVDVPCLKDVKVDLFRALRKILSALNSVVTFIFVAYVFKVNHIIFDLS